MVTLAFVMINLITEIVCSNDRVEICDEIYTVDMDGVQNKCTMSITELYHIIRFISVFIRFFINRFFFTCYFY